MLQASNPPLLWKEHWHEHTKDLERVFFDNDVAVYYDSAVNRSITWPFKYIGDIWRYTKQIYGNFSADNRLFAVLHHGQYHGCHMSTYMSATHDYRPVIDCAVPDGQGWESGPFWHSNEILVHEIGVIVEFSAKGIIGSPAREIWKEVWDKLFAFDVFIAAGRKEEADLLYFSAREEKVTLQAQRVPLFKNWFYPIYMNYGGAETMNNFLTLLSENFPTNTYGTQWKEYSRGLNFGELVHFWSGAARKNLNHLANITFPPVYIEQLRIAQSEFPAIVCDQPDGLCRTRQTINPCVAEFPPSDDTIISASLPTDQEQVNFSGIVALITWSVFATVALVGVLVLLLLVTRKRRTDGPDVIELLSRSASPATSTLG